MLWRLRTVASTAQEPRRRSLHQVHCAVGSRLSHGRGRWLVSVGCVRLLAHKATAVSDAGARMDLDVGTVDGQVIEGHTRPLPGKLLKSRPIMRRRRRQTPAQGEIGREHGGCGTPRNSAITSSGRAPLRTLANTTTPLELKASWKTPFRIPRAGWPHETTRRKNAGHPAECQTCDL